MTTFNLHPIEPGWLRRWPLEALRLVFEMPLACFVTALCFLAVPLLSFAPAMLTSEPRLMLMLTIMTMAPLYALVILGFASWLARNDEVSKTQRARVTVLQLQRLTGQELVPALAKGALLAVLVVSAHASSAPPAAGLSPSVSEIIGGLIIIVTLNSLPTMWLEPFVRHLTLETGAPLWQPTAILALFGALRRVVPLPAMLVLQLVPTLPFLIAVQTRLPGLRVACLLLLIVIQAIGRVAYREVFHGPRRTAKARQTLFVAEHG
jgi:hypothetical protein